MLYISIMARKARHSAKDQAPSKLDVMLEKFTKTGAIRTRQEEFDPRKDLGVSIEEYLDDYQPETAQKQFAVGKEKKAGRPRKDVRDRLQEYMHTESLRLASEMQDQTGVELNFIKRLLAMPMPDGKKTRKLKEAPRGTVTHHTPTVAGSVNVYEFRGRLKVMERLVQIVTEMKKWELEPEEYVVLIWWWCKDAIARSQEEKVKISLKNMTAAFEEERRLFGMINQLERVRNRVRHVAVSAGMDYENIRGNRPAVGLVEMMKQKKEQRS